MPFLGEFAALATAVCWSFTAIIFTAAGKRIGALQVNLFRIPLAIILLGVTYLLVWGHSAVPAGSPLMLAISGVIGLAIGDTFLFQAMILIGSRLSMMLMSLAPPLTAVIAYFFLKESLSFTAIAGVALTVGGVFWVVAERLPDSTGERKRVSPRGVFFAFMGALGQATGLVFAKKGLVPEMNAMLGTLIRMASAGLLLWPATILARRVKNPLRLFSNDLTALRLMLAGVVFGPFLGVWLSLVSVKYTDTGVAATIMSTVPVLMIPLVIIIEKEKPSLRAITGAVVAVAGVAILFLR